MAGIFDFAEQPSWMSPPPSQATGLDIYRDTRNFYERRNDREESKRRFNALLPIQEKMAEQKSAIQMLDVANFMAKSENEKVLKAQYASVMGEMAEIQQQGLMDTPEGRARYFRVLSKNPAVAANPNLRIFENNFDIADRARERAELEETRARHAQELAELRGEVGRQRDVDRADRKMELEQMKLDARADEVDRRLRGTERGRAFGAAYKAATTAETRTALLKAYEEDEPLAAVADTAPTMEQTATATRIKQIDETILAHKRALAGGDESTGLGNLNPFGKGNRLEQIEALEKEKTELLKLLPAKAKAGPIVLQFDSINGMLK